MISSELQLYILYYRPEVGVAYFMEGLPYDSFDEEMVINNLDELEADMEANPSGQQASISNVQVDNKYLQYISDIYSATSGYMPLGSNARIAKILSIAMTNKAVISGVMDAEEDTDGNILRCATWMDLIERCVVKINELRASNDSSLQSKYEFFSTLDLTDDSMTDVYYNQIALELGV